MITPNHHPHEQPEKYISKLESLKLFLNKKYTSVALVAALLWGTWVAVSTLTNSCNVIHKTSITELKENNDNITNAKYIEFWHFLEKQELWTIDRATTLGRYVRISRYRDHIKEAADKYGVPFDYLFALIMVESQGNTASINENDWWAGFIHFQPDVAKEYDMKLFTDNKKYKEYSFEHMKKKWKTKKEIYKKHGEILQGLMDKSMAELEQLDDRFHTTKCINATATYLAKIKKQVDKNKDKACDDDSWNTYKNDIIYDFDRMLTLNGFNKWYGYDKKADTYRFTIGFEDGSHVKNIKHNLDKMRKYDEYVKDMIKEWKSNDDIFKGLKTTKFI